MEKLDLEVVTQLRDGGSIVEPMSAVPDPICLEALLHLRRQFGTPSLPDPSLAWAMTVRYAGVPAGDPIAAIVF
jgi:hypothetical protein